MRIGKNAEILRADGYVPAAEVSRAIARDLGAVHRDIVAGRIPGERIGSGWYVKIHDLVRQQPYPEGTRPMKALRVLANAALKAAVSARKADDEAAARARR